MSKEATLFPEMVGIWYPVLAKAIEDKINDKKTLPTYLYQTMMGEQYSTTLKWETLSTIRSIVAADVVSMSSTLPLKKRDSLQRATGDVPKLGMKMSLNERELNDIYNMIARGASESTIVARIFNDLDKVTRGVYERLEYMFLEQLSTGVFTVDDSNNVGTGVRLSIGYLDKNKFGVEKRWGNPDAKPLTDIEKVITRAGEDGNTITTIVLSKKTYNQMRKSTEAKELFAQSIGFTGANIVAPLPSQFNNIMSDQFGVKFIVVDRAIKHERDGKQTTVYPFSDDSVVFLTSDNVGSVYYGTLVEERTPVSNVQYQKVGNYILTSKFSHNDPYEEFTSSQALAVPVLENVDNIYLLDIKGTEKVTDEGGGDIEVFGVIKAKTDVVTALKSMGVSVSNKSSIDSIKSAISALSNAQKDELKKLLGI